jgi:hypothetical protein
MFRSPPPEMLKEFDKDGDGELNDTERESMRLAMQSRFGGQGAPRGNREEMLKRFDKNGDGQLDEEERTAMREATGGDRQRGGGADRPQRRNRGEGRQGQPGESGERQGNDLPAANPGPSTTPSRSE